MKSNLDVKDLEKNLKFYADNADERIAEFEAVLSRLVGRLDQIGQAITRVFKKAREQKDHLMVMKDRAVDSMEPVVKSLTPVLHRTQDMSKKAAKKIRSNPTPFLVGGAVLVGGMLLTAYLLRKKEAEQEAHEFREGFQAPAKPPRAQTSDFTPGEAANAS